MRGILKPMEYVGHEVYFPGDDPPQDVFDRLTECGFCRSSDGFYIPVEAYELFCTLAYPYKVGIMQYHIILGGKIDLETRQNQILDMINALKAAGVCGIENWIEKIAPEIDALKR